MDQFKDLIQKGSNCNIHELGLSLDDMLQYMFLISSSSTPQWLSKTRVEVNEATGDVIVTDLEAETRKAPIRSIFKVLCEYLDSDDTGTLVTQDKFNQIQDAATFPDILWTDEDVETKDMTLDQIMTTFKFIVKVIPSSGDSQTSKKEIYGSTYHFLSRGACQLAWIHDPTRKTLQMYEKINGIISLKCPDQMVHGGRLLPGLVLKPEDVRTCTESMEAGFYIVPASSTVTPVAKKTSQAMVLSPSVTPARNKSVEGILPVTPARNKSIDGTQLTPPVTPVLNESIDGIKSPNLPQTLRDKAIQSWCHTTAVSLQPRQPVPATQIKSFINGLIMKNLEFYLKYFKTPDARGFVCDRTPASSTQEEDLMLRDFTPDVSWISHESWDSMPLQDRDTERMIWHAELMVFVSMETSLAEEQVSRDAAVFEKASAYFKKGKCKQLWILYATTGRTVEYTIKMIGGTSDSSSKNFIARSTSSWREINGGSLLPGYTVGPGLLRKAALKKSARSIEPVICPLCKQLFDSLQRVEEHRHLFHIGPQEKAASAPR
jgi:hypothetical protein